MASTKPPHPQNPRTPNKIPPPNKITISRAPTPSHLKISHKVNLKVSHRNFQQNQQITFNNKIKILFILIIKSLHQLVIINLSYIFMIKLSLFCKDILIMMLFLLASGEHTTLIKAFFMIEYCNYVILVEIKQQLCNIQYINTSTKSQQTDSLYFFERPFVKNNIRIFLLDCKGYKNSHQLTKQQKNQLDLILSICQVIILIQDQNKNNNYDITQVGYQHLNDSFHRLYTIKKKKLQSNIQICWPKSLFILYNTSNSIKKHQKSMQYQKQLCCMFRDYNFSILHKNNNQSQFQIKSYTTITNQLQQLYLKNTSIIFRNIYDKIQGKYYMNIRYNGFTFPHILTQEIHAINQHNNLYLPKAFNKAKKSVFLSIYNRHALGYLLKMKQFIGEQKPYSTDYLLSAFQNTSDETIQQYNQVQNQVAVRPAQDSLCLQYEKKLQDYIEQKQKNILVVNSKKSIKQLQTIFVLPTNEISSLLTQFKKIKNIIKQNHNFDHNTQALILGNFIKQLCIKYPTLSIIQQKNNIINNNNHSSNIEINHQLIKSKIQLLNQKKKQYQLLNKQIILQNNYQQQQQTLKTKIKSQQQKLAQLKKMLNSQQNPINNTLIIKSLATQIKQLKNIFNQKILDKNYLQSQFKNITSPQTQILLQKINHKKQQISNIMQQSHQQGQVIRYGGPLAERRVIDQRNSRVRRVNDSSI